MILWELSPKTAKSVKFRFRLNFFPYVTLRILSSRLNLSLNLYLFIIYDGGSYSCETLIVF